MGKVEYPSNEENIRAYKIYTRIRRRKMLDGIIKTVMAALLMIIVAGIALLIAT